MLDTPVRQRPGAPLRRSGCFLSTLGLAAAIALPLTAHLAHSAPDDAATRGAGAGAAVETVELTIPGTTVAFTMVRVPAGQAPPPAEGAAPEEFGTFWIGAHEVTWDLYDVYVYGLDLPDGDPGASGADATSRPTKPYVPPDRGFGHAGYPAMGMTHMAAERFCAWLSEKTGRRFRLPTEAEWEYACRGATTDAYAFGSEASSLGTYAWIVDNAERTTHPVGQKPATARGLHDIHGNVAEWTNGRDGKPVAKGGSFRDGADKAASSYRMKQRSSWQASDPQIPKSTWWLADCSWVGFRLVMEDDPAPAPPPSP